MVKIVLLLGSGAIGLQSTTIFTVGNINIAQNSRSGFANHTSVVFVANSSSWINSNNLYKPLINNDHKCLRLCSKNCKKG